jgi:excisionase family DNA binding protein
MVMKDRLLTPQEVAEYFGVPLATLYQWRSRGVAPRGIRVGRHIRFRESDLDAFVAARLDQPRAAR